MEKVNLKFENALLDLALETGKGENSRQSWHIFLQKLKACTGCTSCSVWHYDKTHDRLFKIASDESHDAEVTAIRPSLVQFPQSDFHLLPKSSMPDALQKVFTSLENLLVVINLDGYGALILVDPIISEKAPSIIESLARIGRKQAEASMQLDYYKKLRERNFKKRRIIQKLREWKMTFLSFFENINDAILIIDQDGVIVNANKATRQLLSISNDFFKKVKLQEVIACEATNNFQNLIQKTKEYGFLNNYECNFNSAAGKKVYCLVNCVQLNSNGNFSGYLISIHDITPIREAENAIEKLMQTHEQILFNLPLGLLLVDSKGRLMFVNPYFYEIFKNIRSEKDLENFSYDQHFKNPEIEKRRVAELLEKMQPTTNDVLPLKDGRIVSRDFIPIRYAGDVVAKLWTFKDISESFYAHEELNASERRFRGIIENLSLGILEWSPDKRVVSASKIVSQLLHADQNVLVGKTAREIFDFDGDIFERQANDFVKEVQSTLPNLEKKYFLISTVPVFDQNTEIKGYMSVVFDITQRKKMEEELRMAKQRAIEDRNLERNFLANMSHEIRTPLNAIIGMTNILKNTRLDDEQIQLIDSLESASNFLLHLLNDILDLSKIEAGQMELDEREFNLHALCNNLLLAYKAKEKEKLVQLILRFDENIKHAVIGDPVRLQQILGNLINNAWKFTPRGVIVLEVALVLDKGNAYHIKFAVHDTGIGIPKNKQKVIFGQFKQAYPNISNEYGGTGLGLAIVRQLVELHGGFIEVESTEGKGSTFSFLIDLKKSDKLASQIVKPASTIGTTSKTLQDGKFLIVDDNLTNLKLMSKMFEMWGCQYVLATSGNEAIFETRQNEFDLILMDLRMPGMSGCEATLKIRNDPFNLNRTTPIIALSAAILPDDRKRALMAGMNDFLPKPFSPENLLECLHRHLQFKVQPATGGQPVEVNKDAIQQPADDAPDKPNLTYLLEFSKGDKNFVNDLVSTFLKDAPEAIHLFEIALSGSNTEEAANILHRIRPNLETLGLHRLSKKALHLETQLKHSSAANLEHLMKISSPFINQFWQALSTLRFSLTEL